MIELKRAGVYYNLVSLGLSLQHVIILFLGIILVPTMLAHIHGLDHGETHYLLFVTTLGAAFSTLLQPWKFKNIGLGMPMFMGTSGAFMSCAHASLTLGGISLFSSLSLLATPFLVFSSYTIRYLRHILTPTVGGVIIMLVIPGLLKDSINTWVSLGNQTQGSNAYLHLFIGFFTIGVMVFFEWFGNKKFRPWGILLGILSGTAISILFDGISFDRLQGVSWIGFPTMHRPEFSFEPFNLGHWAAYFTFVVSVQVTFIKYVGDAMALQRVAYPEQKKVNYDAIQGGLYANSIGMAFTSILGGMPSTSHSPNIPVMEISGIVSRTITTISAILLALLICSPKVVYILQSIPSAVIGGTGVVLVAYLFSTGLRMVASELNFRNGIIAGLSLNLGLIAENPLFFPGVFPEFLRPLTENGFAVGGLVAIFLTLLSRINVKDVLTFEVQSKNEEIEKIVSKLEFFSAKVGMSVKNQNILNLASEEVFIYAMNEMRSQEESGSVKYRIGLDRGWVNVEITFGTRLDSEFELPENIVSKVPMTEEELDSFGLVLLNRIVDDIRHVTISNYTYISFRLRQQ